MLHNLACAANENKMMTQVQSPKPQQDENVVANSIERHNLKRKSTTSIDGSQVGNSTKHSVLSLTKPSYALALGSKNLRAENRARLSHLLRQLLRQQNWTEASGVLSVLLKGTGKDKTLPNNRFKYTALMEVLTHISGDDSNVTTIKNIYDVWMRKIGLPKGRQVEGKFVVHLEFILFCLTEGNVEDAHQAALSLIQENAFDRDPVSCMVIGLTFYQLWYSTVPKEMLLTDSEQVAVSLPAIDNTNSQEAVTDYPCNSDSSIKNERISSMEIGDRLLEENSMGVNIETGKLTQNFQPQGFYANSTDDTGNEGSIFNFGDRFQYASNFSALEGLDSLLLPVRLPRSFENSEDFLYLQTEMFNNYYKEAVKYLRLALCSTLPVLAALLPLIQLLLVGGQVDEALKVLHEFCCISNTTLPIRLRAKLLEHVDRRNNTVLFTCYEDMLKKDPTSSHSLAKLVTMHRNGEYSSESLVEMIALHLDATYADHNTWREFASCFLKLSENKEDRMSCCQNGNGSGLEKKCSVTFNEIPDMFKEGKSRKNWRLRCKWWLKRHFSRNTVASEIAAGDLQLPTYKAASACHIYGPELAYVTDVYTCLEEKNERDLFLFLELNIGKSIRLCSSFAQRE